MKKIVLFVSIALISINFCTAQEWFANFDFAKKLALVQDKMLFVVWEESLDFPYPITYTSNNGDLVFIDLSKNDNIDEVIWEHFIPVLLSESNYDELAAKSKDRGARYIAKLNDDSIKIMDVNRNILNLKPSAIEQNLSLLINNYSLKTTFLKQDLINYSNKENFRTSFNLGSKYIDFALFVEKDTRNEVIELANIYFEESKKHLAASDSDTKEVYTQRLALLSIKEDLVLDKPRRALRLLKKMEVSAIAERNYSLYSFLNYTTFKLLKDEKNLNLWQSKISEADLKKAELIFNINN